MATTDIMCIAQRPLAVFAYELQVTYNLTRGHTFDSFMLAYDEGEIQLSSVYENLFVAARNTLGKPTKKVSGDGYDFIKVFRTRTRVLGDMKTTVLQKDRKSRRFVVNDVRNKTGIIFVVAWNWLTEEVNFFAIPPDSEKTHPKAGYKIPVCKATGNRSKGWYNENCAYDTFEQMVMVG